MILYKIIIKVQVFYSLVLYLLISNAANSLDKPNYFNSYLGSILSGQIAKYNNENEIASKFYSFANKKNPNNEDILELSLMSLILSGNVDGAINQLSNYEDNFIIKKSQISQLLKFLNLIKKEDYQVALKLLKNNKEILITEKMQPLIKAWLASDFESAEKFINKFEYKTEGLMLSDTYFLHLALLNNFYENEKDSLKIFEKTLKFGEEDKLRHLYFYYNLIGDIKYKNDFLNTFSNKNPDHSFNVYLQKKDLIGFKVEKRKDGVSESLFNIAEALYNQRMYESSIAYSYLSLYLNKSNYINYYLIAQNYQMLGKAKKAIKVLSYIPINTYLGWNARLKSAGLNINLNNYKNAESDIIKLKNYASERIDIFYKLGELYHNKKVYNKAISAFDKAIFLLKEPKEKDWYLYYSRGMAFERSKDWKKAEKDFLYALKLSPNQPLVLNYLGYTWVDFGIKLDEAEEFIKIAIRLRPKDGYFIDSLGWAYYRQGKYNLAVSELEKAVSLVPNDPIINDHLGDALYRAGYKNEAIYQWNRALLYEPEKEHKDTIEFKLKKGL